MSSPPPTTTPPPPPIAPPPTTPTAEPLPEAVSSGRPQRQRQRPKALRDFKVGEEAVDPPPPPPKPRPPAQRRRPLPQPKTSRVTPQQTPQARPPPKTPKTGRKPLAKTASVAVVEDTMRAIFDDSQRVDRHPECLQRLNRLQAHYSATNESVTDYYKELVRNLKYTLWVPDNRSPHASNSIDFFVRYLLTFTATPDATAINGTGMAAANGSGDGFMMMTSDEDDEVRHEFIDAILDDVVIPYTNNAKVECRINSCNFIRRLFDEMLDISEDIYEKIRKALLDRSVDRLANVRAAAVLALHRFQNADDANDLVIQAIHFHLNSDPDHEVRHNCVKVMAPSTQSLAYFVDSTRDIKDFIRKSAYIQIADKIPLKSFTIDQRLTILKNGLKDRSAAVRRVVESVLIPAWVKSCDNDLIQLLIALDIQTDIDLIEKMLDIYFKHLNREVIIEESSRTKFTQLVDEFRDQNLRADRVFSVSMNVENVFLWRYLCQFCKTNGIENKDLKAATVDISVTHSIADPIVNGEQTIQQSMATSDEMPIVDIPIVEMPIIDDVSQTNDETEVQTTVDLFDLLVPDVPIFCAYLEKYVHNVTTQHMNDADALDFEFIFNQFMKVSLLLDIGDDAQRKILVQTMRSILIDNKIGDKFHGYITPVMKCLATNGFTDNNAYLDFTVEIISEIFASIESTADENESTVDETNRELEDKRNKLNEELSKWKLELEDMESEGATEETPELAEKIKAAEEEVNGIRDKIAANTSLLSQSSQTSLQSKSLPSFVDHPKSLMSCLQVFSGCLEFGNYTEVNAVMQTHIEKVCLSGFVSDNISVRRVATRCLGLVCLTSAQYFKKYLHFLIEIFLKDIEEIKIISLQSIFDSLCEHGITIFDDKVDKNGLTSEDNSKARQLAFDNDGDEDFITSLKQFFESQLESKVSEIRETTVQGVAKLLIHSRLYSPELLSKMIVIWFTPEENQEIVQFIGDFLRQYALAESLGVIVGQSALQDSFLPTLEILYRQRRESPPKRINAENLIKFFLNLIDDDSHQELAKDLAKRIVDCDQTQTKFAEDYLLLAVTHLNLVSMSNKDLKAFGENMEKIALKFETSKSKAVKKRLVSIVKKIENRGQQLSADTAFEQDFEPIDDIDDTLDQMSAADVTPPRVALIRTNTTADESADPLVDEEGQNTAAAANDSDAESFNTCPESQSPPQKRRRLTTDGESFFDTNEPESALNGLESQPLFDEVNDLETNTSELSLNESTTENSAEPVAEVSGEAVGEETAEPMAEDSDEPVVSIVMVGAEPTNESTSEYVESSEATGAENIDQTVDECMLSTISTGAATADEDPIPEPDPRLDDPLMNVD